jgi:hypothetical protein
MCHFNGWPVLHQLASNLLSLGQMPVARLPRPKPLDKARRLTAFEFPGPAQFRSPLLGMVIAVGIRQPIGQSGLTSGLVLPRQGVRPPRLVMQRQREKSTGWENQMNHESQEQAGASHGDDDQIVPIGASAMRSRITRQATSPGATTWFTATKPSRPWTRIWLAWPGQQRRPRDFGY